MEIPIKLDGLGVPPFSETPIYNILMVVQHLNPYILISKNLEVSRSSNDEFFSMLASQDWEYGGDKFPSRFQDRI